MKTTLKAAGLASSLVVAALVGGTLISAASASPRSPASTGSSLVADDVDAGAYCDLWRQTFADELGVSVDDLTPAGKAAAVATIDAAVANGDLPEDVVYKMTKTMAAHVDDMAAVVKAIAGSTPKDMALDIGVPFHKGAMKFYKEAGAM